MQIPGRSSLAGAVFGALALAASVAAQAQTANFAGSLGNFDVVNNTGQDACGYEIQLDGLAPSQVYGGFSSNRYGAPVIEAYGAGTRMRWSASYDAATQTCSTRTVAHAPGTGFAGTCYQWYPATYAAAGCEHFGVYLAYYATPATITSRWLVVDPASTGALTPHDPPMPVVFPTYYLAPPVAVNAAPVVVAEVQAPQPPPQPTRFGPAQWMKVFRTQLPVAVTLDQLVSDNPTTVPMDPAQVEVAWTIIQADPAVSGGKQKRSRTRNQSPLDPTTRTVVRRYELYDYTGATVAATGEVQCADVVCAAPSAGELGDFVSAQMTAINVQGDFVTVSKSGTGKGGVTGGSAISCGNKCSSPFTGGSTVTLVAKADSGSAFTGWSGACAGTQSSCTVTVNGDVEVGAVFTAVAGGGGGGGGGGSNGTPQFTLQVSASNPGTITSDIGGISCGSVCSVKYNAGTSVTLTATPPAGKSFIGWSGACAGTAPTCALTVNGNLSAKASFSK